MHSGARPEFIGVVVATSGGNVIEAIAGEAASVPAPMTLEAGSIMHVRREHGTLELEELAGPTGALRELYDIVAKYQLDPVFPPEVMEETRAWLENPGLDDPELTDLTTLPFVTIDGASSRDLDQAVFVCKRADRFVVHYAIADASYYVPKDSALWHEAVQRAASYYLPGLMVPMLPREMSEGLVSLNPNVLRRALVFETVVESDGTVSATHVTHARVRSIAKLSFEQVESFYNSDQGIDDPALRQSLTLLKCVGLLRMGDAEERDVVRYRRSELHAYVGQRARRFIATLGVRRAVEAYNEQLSLMCNSEGARLLSESAGLSFVDPIYRVHPPPARERLEELREFISALARSHGVGSKRLTWQHGQALSEYLRDLPEDGPLGRLSKAIHRQAVMVNVRSSYQQTPESHYGVGAAVYGRFSAPMREIVGVFLHRELVQSLRGQGSQDSELSQSIIERANHAKQLQRRLTNEANLLVLNQLFAEQLPFAETSEGLAATVMGMTASKLYVEFDDTPIDAKVRLRDIKNHHRCEDIHVGDDGCRLLAADGELICRVGDQVSVLVLGCDEKRGRWQLSIRQGKPHASEHPVPPSL